MESNANQENNLIPRWTMNQSFLISHIQVYFIVKQRGNKWEQRKIHTCKGYCLIEHQTIRTNKMRNVWQTGEFILKSWERKGQHKVCYILLKNTDRIWRQRRNWRFSRPPKPTERRHSVYQRYRRKWKLPFLTCLLRRDNNGLRTRVYRKLTHTEHS